MQRKMSLGSRDLATANVLRGEGGPPLPTVELAAIICTGLKRAFGAASAAETRSVQWKGSPVQWKGSHVQWKAALRAVESWFSQHFTSADQLLAVISEVCSFLDIILLIGLDDDFTNLLRIVRHA
jgi:hypothetical protein